MKTRARIGAAAAAATMMAGAGVALAPDAMAASGCRGVQVIRDGGHLNLQLRGADCQPVTVNVATYDLPGSYDQSGHFDKTAYPQTLRSNQQVRLVKWVKHSVTLNLPACGWVQWDVYTGPVQHQVGRHGSSHLIAGQIMHSVSPGCGHPTTTTTSSTSTTSTSSTSTSSTTTSTTTSPTSSTTTSPTSTTTSSPSTTTTTTAGSTPSTTSGGGSNSGNGEATNLPATSQLAYTGANTRPGLLLGIALIAAGALALLATRIKITHRS